MNSDTASRHISASPKLVVALDYDDAQACMSLVRQLDPELCRLKVGKELFTACGPRLISSLIDLGFDLFLDLKFHDIPNTVAKAIRAVAKLNVWMVNVHALGGSTMMRAAREALAESEHPPILIAVTILTSMSQDDLNELGLEGPLSSRVERLARLAKTSGLDGVVCSAQEAAAIKAMCGDDFLAVTPGIRPASSSAGDQVRTMTPEMACQAGSDYLVVGRPITQASDPAAACHDIAMSISANLKAEPSP